MKISFPFVPGCEGLSFTSPLSKDGFELTIIFAIGRAVLGLVREFLGAYFSPYLAMQNHHSQSFILFSSPIYPIPASDPLTIEFALDVRHDPEFSSLPDAIHFSGEVFSELS